jgi:Secretion system C-terminal sorting domain/Peptidase family M1 domain
MNEMNGDVLQLCHTVSKDNGYFPLNDIPQDITYGMTAYDRGGTVVQSLRSYLGDSLFFIGAKHYLEVFSYQDASSSDFRDALSEGTGVSMDGFFDNWVFNAGTPHYSIDSFSVSPVGGNFNVDIYPRQKRKGPQFTGNGNIARITLVDENWNTWDDSLHFDGQSGHSLKTYPQKPVAIFVDFQKKTMDAITDMSIVISTPENYSFTDTYFSMMVEEVTDSVLVNVTHNWVAPDSMLNPINGLRLSDYRYWKIEGIDLEKMNAYGKFRYSKGSYLDNTLIETEKDSVIILYRPNPASDWEFIDFSREGIWMTGHLHVPNLKPGEYTLAVWDTDIVSENEIPVGKEDNIKVYPNPSSSVFNIEWENKNIVKAEVFNTKGQLIDQLEMHGNSKQTNWQPNNISKGVYYLVLLDKNKTILANKKIIYQ